MEKQDILDIKTTLNNLLLQTSLINSELKMLSSITLGVYKETLPKEQYRTIYTNYVNRIEESFNEVLGSIDTILFEVGDPAFSIRQRFDFFSIISAMKNSEDYSSDSEQ